MSFIVFVSNWRVSRRNGGLIPLCLVDQKCIIRNNLEIIRQVEQTVGCLDQAYFGKTCNLVWREHKNMLSEPIMNTCDGQQGVSPRKAAVTA